MKRILTLAIALAAAVAASGCQKDPDQDNPLKTVDLTTRSAEFIQKGNSFSFNFLEQVNKASDGDFIISPLSMQFLLGMVVNGAKGNTADQIFNVLGYGKDELPAVNEFCKAMMAQLPSLDRKTTLKIANAFVANNTCPILDTYTANITNYYSAYVQNLDFSNSQAATDAINGWCSKNTNGLIPKVLDEVTPDMLAYALNALYFKSQWAEQFKKNHTSEENFTPEGASARKVNMMKQSADHGYTENDIFQAVSLKYGNGAYSMVVLLPKAGHKTAEIAKYLKTNDWGKFCSSMYKTKVETWIPKFETKFHIKLNDILSDMGMSDAFISGMADFSALSPVTSHLSFVQQDAIIKVDEEGTEAAAVSVAGWQKNAAMPEGPSFIADHTFLYLITEASTGAVLFAGKYGSK
jgi:serpin B